MLVRTKGGGLYSIDEYDVDILTVMPVCYCNSNQ